MNLMYTLNKNYYSQMQSTYNGRDFFVECCLVRVLCSFNVASLHVGPGKMTAGCQLYIIIYEAKHQ